MQFKSNTLLIKFLAMIILTIISLFLFIFKVVDIVFIPLVCIYMATIYGIYYFAIKIKVNENSIYISYINSSVFLFPKITKRNLAFEKIASIERKHNSSNGSSIITINYEDETFTLQNLFTENQINKIIEKLQSYL